MRNNAVLTDDFLAFLVELFRFRSCSGFCDSDTGYLYAGIFRRHRVSRWNGHKHIDALNYLTKNAVFIVQVGCGDMRDEELRTIGVWSCVRHGKHTGFIM